MTLYLGMIPVTLLLPRSVGCYMWYLRHRVSVSLLGLRAFTPCNSISSRQCIQAHLPTYIQRVLPWLNNLKFGPKRPVYWLANRCCRAARLKIPSKARAKKVSEENFFPFLEMGWSATCLQFSTSIFGCLGKKEEGSRSKAASWLKYRKNTAQLKKRKKMERPADVEFI